jgi:hypothetical protein
MARKPQVHTNTVEGFYSIFKRGMKGVYQHCGKQHLHRYAAEFDFRYNHREMALTTPKGLPWHFLASSGRDYFTGTHRARKICAGGAELESQGYFQSRAERWPLLTVQDAFQQAIDFFDLLTDDDNSNVVWKLEMASTNSPFTCHVDTRTWAGAYDAVTPRLEVVERNYERLSQGLDFDETIETARKILKRTTNRSYYGSIL